MAGVPMLAPIGWGFVRWDGYGRVAIFAPWGLHWLIRAGSWLHLVAEYRIPSWLGRRAPIRARRAVLLAWLPWLRTHRDGECPPRGWGMAWRQDAASDEDGFTYIAPIGLNVAYALARFAALRLRYIDAW